MPTYEYRCGACGHRFERLQKFSDDPIRTCPECDRDDAERLISAGAGLLFRGSGFYETDYKQKSPPSAPEGGSDETSGGGSDGGGSDGGGSDGGGSGGGTSPSGGGDG